MTEDEVADKLWQWLTDRLGVPVIYAYQGAKEPVEPYVVLNMIQSGPVLAHRRDNDYPASIDGEIVSQAPVRDWFWRFSINVYGRNAQTILRKVKTAAEIQSSERLVRPLIIAETGRIADATEILNEEWQSRAQMDLELRGVVRDALPIDTAETGSVSTHPV